LYLVCTLLATIWMIGDFNTPDLVSSGAPVGSTEVLATLGVEYLLDQGKPDLGVAAVMAVLPVIIPLAVLLIRRLQIPEVQLWLPRPPRARRRACGATGCVDSSATRAPGCSRWRC